VYARPPVVWGTAGAIVLAGGRALDRQWTFVSRTWLLFILVGAGCSSGAAQPPADLSRLGDETFGAICAKCHGPEGKGGLPATPGGPMPRDLSDPTWQASMTDAQLKTAIQNGKQPIMPAFATVLTQQQIDAVVGKVRRLRRKAEQ
jgi:mono/diheme cytochrome c family protein